MWLIMLICQTYQRNKSSIFQIWKPDIWKVANIEGRPYQKEWEQREKKSSSNNKEKTGGKQIRKQKGRKD